MSILASLNRIVRPGGSRSAAKSAGTIDNRVAPRLPRVSTAQLLQYPAGRHQHPIEVQVTDYSETGIGIIYHEGLIIGRTFVVREPHVTHGKTCLFTVVRSDARPDGTFSIGLHIGNSLDDEHDPLLEVEPAPGIALSSKLLFGFFALIGIAMIVALAVLKHHGK
jgi:hypothetical protein